jgi:hypothetical protein
VHEEWFLPSVDLLRRRPRATTIAGGDCTSVTVSNVQLNGVPLVSSDVYVVTANGFLAHGGDSFTTFEQVPPTAKLDGGSTSPR